MMQYLNHAAGLMQLPIFEFFVTENQKHNAGELFLDGPTANSMTTLQGTDFYVSHR